MQRTSLQIGLNNWQSTYYHSMPTHTKALAEYYLQLARHLEAGIPLPKAWSLPPTPAPKDRRKATERLEAGESLETMIEKSGSWLPVNDRKRILYAAESGRLPEICQQLSERHQRQDKTNRRIQAKLRYPLFVFHLAAIVLPIVRNIDFESGLAGFDFNNLILQVLILLVPLWTLIAIIRILASTRSPLLPTILRVIPILRGYARYQSMANFCEVLGSAWEVGIPPQEAWLQATEASQSRSLQGSNQKIQTILEQGKDPADILSQIPALPKDFIAYYRTGASSGKIDSMMLQLSRDYEERAEEKLTVATAFYPGIALLAVGGMVAYATFQFFGGYLDLLDSFTQ